MKDRRIVGCIGAPGSGKSTLARWLLANLRARGERIAGLDPNGEFGFSFPTDPDAWLERRIERRDATTLLLDDLDGYAPHRARPGSPWAQLYLRHRHLGLNTVWTARRLTNVAPALLSASSLLYVFRSSPADLSGLRALGSLSPDLAPPTEPFRFIALDPYSGPLWTGRTTPAGGVVRVQSTRRARRAQ